MHNLIRSSLLICLSLLTALPAFAGEKDEHLLIQKRFEWFYGTRGLLDPGADVEAARLARRQAVTNLVASMEKQRSQNRAGSLWTSIGPSPKNTPAAHGAEAGRTTAIAFVPGSPNTLYLATSTGGVWKTTNGGTSWTCITTTLPSQSVGAVTVSPVNSNEIWIGTGDYNAQNNLGVYVPYFGAGIFRSTDGGATWQDKTGSGANAMPLGLITDIDIDPQNPNIIMVCGNGVPNGNGGLPGGIWRSADGGSTWAQVYDRNSFDLIRHPTQNNIIFCGRRGSSTIDYGVIKSTDNGVTWNNAASGIATGGWTKTKLVMAPTNPNLLYYLKDDGTLWKTTNGAASWTLVNSSACGSQCGYNLALAVDPSNPNVLMRGDTRPWKSVDGGVSFTSLSAYDQKIHADVQHISFQSAGVSYWGTDGGIYKTTDGGANFTTLNSNLNITQFYDVASHPTTKNSALAGAQDNGEMRYAGNPAWNNTGPGGDGMMAAINPLNPNYAYVSIYPNPNPSIYRSTTGVTGPWKKISQGITDNKAEWVTPYTLAPSDPKNVYVGTERVWHSSDYGTTWAPISPDFTTNTETIKSLAVYPSNSAYVYAGLRRSIWRTTDSGSTWNDITGNMTMDRSVVDIAVDPSDPNHVAVVQPTFTGTTLYYTTNGGATWTGVTNGLPAVPAISVLMVPSPYRIYVGTDVGIYVATNDDGPFVPDMNGMPVGVPIVELEYSSAIDTITAGTYGRGAWQKDSALPNRQNVTVGKGANGAAAYDARVNAYRVDGTQITQINFAAYGTGTFGVNTEGADVTGDTVSEILTGQGPGQQNSPTLKIFSNTGTPIATAGAYNGSGYGLNVAGGNIDGDGFEEALTGPGPGPIYGPQVRGWNYDNTAITAVSKVNFYAYGTLRYGVKVTSFTFDADGNFDEIVSGAGPGNVFGPHVRGWNYDNTKISAVSKINFFAYGTLKWGVNVKGGDLDNDGYEEIVTGPGPGNVFGPQVRGFNVDNKQAKGMGKINFLAYSSGKFGVNIAVSDLDGDSYTEIATGQGPDASVGAVLKGFDYDGSAIAGIPAMQTTVFSGLNYGITVGAGSYGY